jgi:hypothetical protein
MDKGDSDFVDTNFKVKGEYYDLNYTITRKKYTKISEAHEPFGFLFVKGGDIKPEILDIFNRLFGRVEVTYSLEKGRTFIIDTFTSDVNPSEYKITRHDEYLNNGRLIFTSPSPSKLLNDLLDSPFMDYIRLYKINYQTVL